MSNIFKNAVTNWKTSLAGFIVIGLGVLHQFLGITVPGFTDPGMLTDLTVGTGLIVAQDGTKALTDVLASVTGTSAK